METILKAAGIIIVERKLLVTRATGKDIFVAPGGKIEAGESLEQALIRELYEELGITVVESDLTLFGAFRALAAGQENKMVEMTVYRVASWQGEPIPGSEIAEIAYATSEIPEGMKVGSIFEHDVIPQLKANDFID
jgi:8-oxo-dGTP diphosphatase